VTGVQTCALPIFGAQINAQLELRNQYGVSQSTLYKAANHAYDQGRIDQAQLDHYLQVNDRANKGKHEFENARWWQ
jgi:hypothetical protein